MITQISRQIRAPEASRGPCWKKGDLPDSGVLAPKWAPVVAHGGKQVADSGSAVLCVQHRRGNSETQALGVTRDSVPGVGART